MKTKMKRIKLSAQGIVKQIRLPSEDQREAIIQAWNDFLATDPSADQIRSWRYHQNGENLDFEARSRGGKKVHEQDYDKQSYTH